MIGAVVLGDGAGNVSSGGGGSISDAGGVGNFAIGSGIVIHPETTRHRAIRIFDINLYLFNNGFCDCADMGLCGLLLRLDGGSDGRTLSISNVGLYFVIRVYFRLAHVANVISPGEVAKANAARATAIIIQREGSSQLILRPLRIAHALFPSAESARAMAAP